jgi:hypothetical protein
VASSELRLEVNFCPIKRMICIPCAGSNAHKRRKLLCASGNQRHGAS